ELDRVPLLDGELRLAEAEPAGPDADLFLARLTATAVEHGAVVDVVDTVLVEGHRLGPRPPLRLVRARAPLQLGGRVVGLEGERDGGDVPRRVAVRVRRVERRVDRELW